METASCDNGVWGEATLSRPGCVVNPRGNAGALSPGATIVFDGHAPSDSRPNDSVDLEKRGS